MKTQLKTKLVNLFFMVSILSSVAVAQVTVDVTCGGTYGGTCFFNIDPCVEVNYNTVTTDNPTVTAYLWTVTGGTIQGGNTNPTVNVIWNNTPNGGNTAKKIKVKITYNGNSSTTESPEKPVDVKHIGSINNININGSTYSNGNTHVHPCSTQPISVSVPNVYTDPSQPVTYYWSYPSGWSGPSTSSSSNTSVSVTPSLNQGGTLRVEAQRNDGQCRVSISINIVRPLPTIPTISGNGPAIVCENQVVNLTASASNADSYSWETISGNISFNNNGNSTVGISATESGQIRVRSYSNSCQVYSGYSFNKDIYFGVPIIVSKTVNGSPAQSANYVSGSAQLGFLTANSANNCNWSIDGGSGYISPSGFNCYASISGSFVRVRGQTSNTCGNGESYVFYLLNGSGYRMASSNPTKSGSPIQVVFDDKRLAEDLLEDMTLFSEKEKQVYKFDIEEAKTSKYFKDKENVEISTKGLEKGLYYLRVSLGGKKYTERLVVE